ncbi:MAG TPA: GTP cyclohydrolase I FolE [Armatimonadota bacterium]|nr:GTP cyclohydrolase I FolE [Armatimonadota bacterium]
MDTKASRNSRAPRKARMSQAAAPARVVDPLSPDFDEDDIGIEGSTALTATLGGALRVWTDEQLETMAEGVRLILKGLGEDLDREGLRGTPVRVARMYADLCSGHHFKPTTFANEENYSEMVLVRDIQFYSLCEHHLMPWFGHATVAYLPGKRIVGLSKLGRVVEQFARRLQLQERFTMQVARSLSECLEPRGVAVCVSAEHLCMSARGIRKPGHHTHTFALLGEFEREPYRSEFLRICPSCG